MRRPNSHIGNNHISTICAFSVVVVYFYLSMLTMETQGSILVCMQMLEIAIFDYFFSIDPYK